MSELRAIHLSLREANDFVSLHHRHHKPVRFHLFSVGAMSGNALCGAVTVMRPVNQHRAFEGFMAEVCRLTTDGTKNVPSFLLGRAAKISFAMGFMGIQTYTLPEEGGSSLRAAGWWFDGRVRGKPWSSNRRKRNDTHPLGDKFRWVRVRSDIAQNQSMRPVESDGVGNSNDGREDSQP